jgi:hypothetical protein
VNIWRGEGEWNVVIKYNEDLYRRFKDIALNSRYHKMPDCTKTPSCPYNLENPKAKFTANWPVGTSRFEWKERAKGDAARLLRCRIWKLTVQNRTILRKKLWEAKG